MTSSNARRGRLGDPHGWNSLANYLKVHQSYLDDLQTYFVEAVELQYLFTAPDTFVIRGRVRCRHGLFVDVNKTLEFRSGRGGQVRTHRYSYHAGIAGPTDRPVFRYDNAHSHEGHPDEHHKHRYDPKTWQEIRPPVWIGQGRWPHLDQVIRELHDWWEASGQDLLNHDSEQGT